MTARSSAAADEPAQLRLASLAEGATLLLLLLVAVPGKHAFGRPEATRVMAPVHGLAFVFHVYTLAATVSGGGWCVGEVERLALAAFVPSDAFAKAGLLRRKEAGLAMSPRASPRPIVIDGPSCDGEATSGLRPQAAGAASGKAAAISARV